jgi:hypothetical protein
MADARVWYVAVSSYFIRRINYDDPLSKIVGEDAGDLAQHGGLAYSRASQKQDALSGFDQVLYHFYGPENGAAHAAGQSNDASPPIPYCGNAVQRALDAGPVVLSEIADARGHVFDVGFGDFDRAEHHLAAGEAGFRLPSKVKDHFR